MTCLVEIGARVWKRIKKNRQISPPLSKNRHETGMYAVAFCIQMNSVKNLRTPLEDVLNSCKN
jgi:hypothetical protein